MSYLYDEIADCFDSACGEYSHRMIGLSEAYDQPEQPDVSVYRPEQEKPLSETIKEQEPLSGAEKELRLLTQEDEEEEARLWSLLDETPPEKADPFAFVPEQADVPVYRPEQEDEPLYEAVKEKEPRLPLSAAEKDNEPLLMAVKDNEPRLLLKPISSDELMTRCYPRKRYLVDTLLTPGLTVLAGAPKVGKSWLVLHLCMQIAKGEPFLGLNVTQGSVLYIALEDDYRRLQSRIYRITDEGSSHLHLVTECAPIGDRLDEEITDFVANYRDTRLVVIDTFQKIRERGRELSYANDYSEVSFLKKIADYLNISILLVHHTRKQGDSDYMNEISGTNGIAGSADTLMVLKKENRCARSAILSCTGRDIEDREMKLYLNRETCIWELKSDSLSDRDDALPEMLTKLIAYVKEIGSYEGANTDFAARFCAAKKCSTGASHLKKLMNQYCYELQDNGVIFESGRTVTGRQLKVWYEEKFDTSLRTPR